MTRRFKAALCAAAVTCAAPASAASFDTIDFVLSSAGPLSYGSDVAGFQMAYTATSDVAATFSLTLSAYDYSVCRIEAGCVDYDPHRSSTITLFSDPSGIERFASVSISYGGGRLGPIGVLFSTASVAPITVSLTPIGATLVPEPATWALMFGGFAMVGYATRRRRVAIVFA